VSGAEGGEVCLLRALRNLWAYIHAVSNMRYPTLIDFTCSSESSAARVSDLLVAASSMVFHYL
jgi:methylmalonyl-CoA mutase N-terminal domain/subunit